MRGSLILQTTSRLLLPLLLVFSVAVLLRGHNVPGGGFVGGLLAASAFILQSMALGPASARRLLGLDPLTWLGVGLLLATASGLLAMLTGLPFLTGLWGEADIALIGVVKAGTPVLFDLGVYLVVAASMLLMIFTLQEH